MKVHQGDVASAVLPHSFVISRVTDRRRREHFSATFPAHSENFEFVDAVDGKRAGFDPATYAKYHRGVWRGGNRFQLGSFANFLTHIKAWETIVNRGLQRALVFEDDALVGPEIGRAMQEWSSEYDLVFLNHWIDTWTVGLPDGRGSTVVNPRERPFKRALKLALGRPVDTSRKEIDRPRPTIDVRAAVRNIILRELVPGRQVRYPGSCGYGVTNKGAQLLLDFVSRTGITINVDWFLVAAGVSLEDLRNFGRPNNSSFEIMQGFCESTPPLRTGITGTPCVHEVSAYLGGSVR